MCLQQWSWHAFVSAVFWVLSGSQVLAQQPVPGTAPAGAVGVKSERRIVEADLQRQRLEVIAKSACLARASVDVDNHLQELAETEKQFARTLTAQLAGWDTYAIPEPMDQITGDRLKALAQLWQGHRQNIQQYLAAPRAPEKFEALGPLFSASSNLANELADIAWVIIQAGSTDGTVDPELANAIYISGRQRTLLQRLSKQICFVASDIDAALNSALLRGTLALLDSTREELRTSVDAIPVSSVQRRHIKDQYDIYGYIWQPFRERVGRIIETRDFSRSTLEYVASQDEALMASLNTEHALLAKLATDMEASLRR